MKNKIFLILSIVFLLIFSMGLIACEKSTKGLVFERLGDNYIVVDYNGIDTNVIIPSKHKGRAVIGIEQGAFESSSITSVTISDSVESIGKNAFYGCNSLESITLPFVGASKNGTENAYFGYIFGSDGDWNNNDCVPASLKTVVITGGTRIEKKAFYRCTNLKNITIENSVQSIGCNAFSYCYNLSNVTIGNGVKDIGEEAFSYCEKLKSVAIGASVENIGKEAFYNCTSLKSVIIPDSVTVIGDFAFYNCRQLTSIIIPDSVTSLGNSVFYWCESLTSVTIGNNVENIGEEAFYNCTSLKSVIIGTIMSIGEAAFAWCSNITNVFYKGTINGWKSIVIEDRNNKLTEATCYIYSEFEPMENGNYWHYDTDGVTPLIWLEH